MKRFLLCAVLLLSACRPVAAPATEPTPLFLQVQFTPALAVLRPHFQSCALAQPGLAVIALERPADALTPAQVTFALRWDEPPRLEGYAADIAQEALVPIVHPSNPLAALNRAQIDALLADPAPTWERLLPQGKDLPLHLWVYPSGDDARGVLEDALLQHSVPAGSAAIAPDPQAMRQAIAADPDALGFLPTRWLDASVRLVPLDVPSPRPILALSAAEPQGAARQWLLCLQNALSQE